MSDLDGGAPGSTEPGSTEPLVVEFVVNATPEHAFDTWVSDQRLWWPRGHTISGDPADIVLEGRVGGRVYERDRDGAEHVWAEVLAWEPPVRVRLLWHLFFSRDEATQLEVTFRPAGTDRPGTLVRLVQTGWDALGDAGPPRRERTIGGWAAVTGPYRAAFGEAGPATAADR